MEEEKKKYNNKALLGTMLFHGALLLVFFFFGLTTPLPLPEEQGVMVSLGAMDQGMGVSQPVRATPPPPQPQPTQSDQPAEDVVTQNTEESVSIPDSPRDRTPQETTTPQPTPPQPQPVPEPEPDPEPQVDPRALFPGPGNQGSSSQSQGSTAQSGNQGSPDGDPEGTSPTGGGDGGVQFNLSGRSPNSLPLPEYNSSATGKVVVTITVNRNGEVIRAIAGARGTTISDRTLWEAAKEAALRSRFNSTTDEAHEQIGSITYNFIRLN